MISNQYRTNTCGELSKANIGSNVTLSGWVHRKRDHGSLLFIDLRDNYGMTQCVVDTTKPEFADIAKIHPESVMTIVGNVVARDSTVINTKIPTGEIEVDVKSVKILTESEVLPFQVFGEEETNEELRLKYRYLDLRRDTLHKNILFRNRVVKFMRDQMWDMGFSEFQTPILGATSPEGARDFIVPSRYHHGMFYALPQAPQQWKQLLQISGFDRYFQIAPCFRDEDLRADRLLEFYQLDLEMSFVELSDIQAVGDKLMPALITAMVPNAKVHPDIPHYSFDYVMETYGSDKPDLRNPITLSDVSDIFVDSDFGIFADAIKNNGAVVRAIPAPKTADKPRSFFDKIEAYAKTELGLAGLGYIVYGEEPKGPIAKKLSADQVEAIRVKSGATSGDSVFFICEQPAASAKAAGKLRNKFGEDLELINKNEFRLCWVEDFPFFEETEESPTGIAFGHNPFSRPQGDLENLDLADPLKLKAYQFDMVLNGAEICSGGLRNYNPRVMLELFNVVGLGEEEVKDKFGGMYTAFQYGAPPHGGCAFGLDRIVQIMLDEVNLRQIVAFPTNQRGMDLMMGSPSEASEKQLREVHIQVRKKS